ANEEGFDLVCLTSSDSAPMTAPDSGQIIVTADSDLQALGDLVGKKVAVNSLNSLQWAFLVADLENNGIDPTTVEFAEVPYPSMGDALATGQVDAYVTVEPFGTVAVEAGDSRVLGPNYVNVIP